MRAKTTKHFCRDWKIIESYFKNSSTTLSCEGFINLGKGGGIFLAPLVPP